MQSDSAVRHPWVCRMEKLDSGRLCRRSHEVLLTESALGQRKEEYRISRLRE